MNRQPSERHIIWSNLSLDVDDWREAYKEFLEANELDADPNDENGLYEYMVETNDEYLTDERLNLNVRLSQPIIVIGDLGLWNGRRSGYKMIDSGNIKDCLFSDTDYTEWYVDMFGIIPRTPSLYHPLSSIRLRREQNLTRNSKNFFGLQLIKTAGAIPPFYLLCGYRIWTLPVLQVPTYTCQNQT